MKIKVFVIDDDIALSEEVGQFLIGKGYEVKTAPTISESKKILSEFIPDIILLDLKLPDSRASGCSVVSYFGMANVHFPLNQHRIATTYSSQSRTRREPIHHLILQSQDQIEGKSRDTKSME